MADGGAGGIFWSRPDLFVNGQKKSILSAGLMGLKIQETTEGLYSCEALFGNWNRSECEDGFVYSSRELLDFGAEFQVNYQNEKIFFGRIMAIEGRYAEGATPQIMIYAEDKLQGLRMTRRTRTFQQLSDAEIISQVCSEHQLNSSVNIPGPAHAVVAQVNQSDLAFIRDRARLHGAEVWVNDGTLHVKPRIDRGTDALRITLNDRLKSFMVIADLAHQRTSVYAQGWDVSSKNSIKAQANESVIANELQGDISGMSLVSSALLKERHESLVHTVPHTFTEAKAHAESFARNYARKFVVGHGVAETDHRFRVGAFVNLQGLGSMFNGRYYISRVTHIFDSVKGLRTKFTGERPGIGQV